jgi:hypothetical protein
MTNLADTYAALKNQIDALTAQLDAVKKDIKALGLPVIEGDFCTVTLSLSERTSLDTTAVKALLTAEQIAANTKVALVETIRVKAKVAA